MLEVVGILGYAWPGGIDETSPGVYSLGARELPNSVINVYRELGRAVRGRAR